METLIRVADPVGITPFVRVTQSTDEADIHRALEAGAMGLFLPKINSVEDVKKPLTRPFTLPRDTAVFAPPCVRRTAAVVDAGGCLLVLKREDGSSILRPDIAHAKAWGPIGMGIGGRAMATRAEKSPEF